MNTDIRYIFLDLGGTFRVIDKDPAYLAAARAKIAELCGVKTEDPTQWFEDVIDKRYDVYREWALKYMCEAPEEVLWRRWLAYDCDPELIRRNASELCYQYRQTKGRRTVVEGGADTVKELCRRGIPWASSRIWWADGKWMSGWIRMVCAPISRRSSSPRSPISGSPAPQFTITPWKRWALNRKTAAMWAII